MLNQTRFRFIWFCFLERSVIRGCRLTISFLYHKKKFANSMCLCIFKLILYGKTTSTETSGGVKGVRVGQLNMKDVLFRLLLWCFRIMEVKKVELVLAHLHLMRGLEVSQQAM